ncbi:hypothetical protein CsSME_00046534 [Camellia sinensis var. sinensis]
MVDGGVRLEDRLVDYVYKLIVLVSSVMDPPSPEAPLLPLHPPPPARAGGGLLELLEVSEAKTSHDFSYICFCSLWCLCCCGLFTCCCTPLFEPGPPPL